MTTLEFSALFDVLWNNISSNQAPGIDEYEKSVFLTKAQKMLVRRLFDPMSDLLREGFDGSQQRQYDFSSIIKTEKLLDVTEYTENIEKTDKRSSVFMWPKNCFLAINEMIQDKKGYQYTVSPISYDEYYRQMTKPYQFPVKRNAWRLMTNNTIRSIVDRTNLKYTYSDKRYYFPISKYSTLLLDEDTSKRFVVSINPYINSELLIDIDDNPITDSDCKAVIDAQYTPRVGSNEADVLLSISCYTETSSTILNLLSLIETLLSLDDEYLGNGILSHGYFLYPDSNGDVTFSSTKPSGIYYKFYCTQNFKNFMVQNIDSNIEFPFTVQTIIDNTAISSGMYLQYFYFGYSSIAEVPTDSTESDNVTLVEILGRFQNASGALSTHNIDKYILRYVETLSPIVLVDLTGTGLEIDGVAEETLCKLPVECHQEILELAVTLAKIAWLGGTATLAESALNSRQRERE